MQITPRTRALARLLAHYEAGRISRGQLRRLWRAVLMEHC